MKNIKQSIEGDELVLRMKLTENFGPSKSGKTTIVASSEGNQEIPWEDLPDDMEMFLGLNLYTKKVGAKKKKK